jgi:hypothetical protein
MPLSKIFLFDRGGQFYFWGGPEKTTDMSQIPEKIYHIML